MHCVAKLATGVSVLKLGRLRLTRACVTRLHHACLSHAVQSACRDCLAAWRIMRSHLVLLLRKGKAGLKGSIVAGGGDSWCGNCFIWGNKLCGHWGGPAAHQCCNRVHAPHPRTDSSPGAPPRIFSHSHLLVSVPFFHHQQIAATCSPAFYLAWVALVAPGAGAASGLVKSMTRTQERS